jgi:F-type H+-transporting ATPase subunit a
VDELILAAEGCDPSQEIICTPGNVNELFEFRTPLFELAGFAVTRTVILVFFAAVLVLLLLWLGLRRKSLVPTRFGAAIEALVGFVREGIAIDIIGPEGARYAPWLLSLFFFILIGNLFEVTPFINFPVTSRIALPAFLSLITYLVFMLVGFKRQGLRYVTGIAWPRSVPVALRPLVGLIELVSTFFLRPLTLAVRLFANMVAGHLMLTLLLVSGWVFISHVGDIGPRALIGLAWFTMGVGIYVFEIVVALLQAYIFTLLSAVYVQTSLYPEH